MTLEQAKQKILDAQSVIKQKKWEIEETKLRMVAELCPFSLGDKVKVEYIGKGNVWKSYVECFISEISVDEISVDGNYFYYRFAKIKRDGTMSGQSAGVYYYPNSHLITKIS